MLWHITKRELYDNMNSLRFALTTLLILALMMVNAIGHIGGEHKARMGEYRKQVSESLDKMRPHTDNLYHLVGEGPGDLYKKPSSLAFCAHGGEAFLPGSAAGRKPGWSSSWGMEDFKYSVEGIWRMSYPQSNPNLWDIMPDFTKIDWAFVIAVALSLVAILFTFDAISGERERGTLRLMLSNSVPRDIVLLGKFFGALITIAIPFLTAVLINLFLLYASGSVSLGPGEWERLGAIFLIALVYVSIFIALGILVSTRVRQSSMSLMILLLCWVVLVVLTPSTLGSIISGLKPTQTSEEFRARQNELRRNLREQYDARGRFKAPLTREIPATAAVRLWSDSATEEVQSEERLNEEHLKAQIKQVKLARSLTRISPASIVQYAIESLAGTGFPRHLQFLEQVKRYAAEFREFLVETDRADPESPHAIGIVEGTSEKPVNFEAIPKFEDRLTFSGSLNAAVVDILLLILFLMVLFAGAYLSFLRAEV